MSETVPWEPAVFLNELGACDPTAQSYAPLVWYFSIRIRIARVQIVHGFVSGSACLPPHEIRIKSPSGRTDLRSQREISLSQFVRMCALSRGAFSSLSLTPPINTPA